MKDLKSNLFVLLILIAVQGSVFAQSNYQDTVDTSRSSIGGELKGLYIAGGISIVGGATIGFLSNGFNDYPRTGLPFIAGGIGLAPGSLIGLGLGSLFAKNHSNFFRSFQIGLGTSYSSPIFSEFVSGNSHRAGINIRVLSNEIGPWRYSLSFSKYFSEEYVFVDIPAYRGYTELSWWELDLDLQYLISINDSFKLYPFIGTQYNQVNSSGTKVNTEILANYGIGTNVEIIQGWSLFGEIKFTIDPDDNPGNTIMGAGLLYSL